MALTVCITVSFLLDNAIFSIREFDAEATLTEGVPGVIDQILPCSSKFDADFSHEDGSIQAIANAGFQAVVKIQLIIADLYIKVVVYDIQGVIVFYFRQLKIVRGNNRRCFTFN